MNNINIIRLLQRATDSLRLAEEESNRPSGDTVSYCICHHSKQALADLLMSFLLMNGVDASGTGRLEDLRKMCSAIDKNFEGLEFEGMECHPTKIENEEHYCLEIARVEECLKIANRAKDMVWLAYRKKEKNYSN